MNKDSIIQEKQVKVDGFEAGYHTKDPMPHTPAELDNGAPFIFNDALFMWLEGWTEGRRLARRHQAEFEASRNKIAGTK